MPLGFSEESDLHFIKAREDAYPRLFGPKYEVNHELDPQVPHVDVYVFPPRHPHRAFFTLVTGGMSDLPMQQPPGSAPSRTELVIYAKEPQDPYIGYLRFLAHLAHDKRTWFSVGSTTTNGNPPQPIFDDSCLDCVLFLPSIVEPDKHFSKELVFGGSPVGLLWVVPVSSAECRLVREKGLDSFLGVLDENNHPVVLNENRSSYV